MVIYEFYGTAGVDFRFCIAVLSLVLASLMVILIFLLSFHHFLEASGIKGNVTCQILDYIPSIFFSYYFMSQNTTSIRQVKNLKDRISLRSFTGSFKGTSNVKELPNDLLSNSRFTVVIYLLNNVNAIILDSLLGKT